MGVYTALSIEAENSNISKNEREEYSEISDNIFDVINKLILINPSTTNASGVIQIVKKKGISDYTINGESLFGIMQNVVMSIK